MRLPVLAALLIAVPAAACAQAPEARHPHHTMPGDSGLTTLRLSDSAQRAIRQDRLTIQLRAEITGANAAQVQAEINRRIANALARARATQGVRPETGGYWVNQERHQNAPVRWHGTQSLTLTGPDPAILLTLAGELQQAEMIMSAMNYDVTPATAQAAQDELSTEALRRLRERADKIAAAMGLTVRNIREIRVGNVDGTRPPPRPMAMMRAEAMAAQAPSAEPGETIVQVTVDADIVLGPTARP